MILKRLFFGACLLSALVFPNASFADSPAFCNLSPESLYCSDAWRGLSRFAGIFSGPSYVVRYVQKIPQDSLDHPLSDDVAVWINPPAFPRETIEHIAKQLNLLIFDESNASADWFESWYQTAVVAASADQINFLPRINANPSLPVLELDEHQKKMFHINDERNYQLPLNHPTPLFDPENRRFFFFFPYPPFPAQPHIIVFRDESLPTNLMMQTLDNTDIITAALHQLCRQRQPCKILLIEPNFSAPAHGFQSPQQDPTVAERLDKIKENITNTINNNKDIIDRFPWRFIIAFIFGAWLLLILWILLPFSRNKI